MIDGQSQYDRHYYHLYYAQEHSSHIDVNRLSCEHPDEGGSDHWSKERGNSCHCHAKGYVTFCQIADDITCRATRTTAHEDYSDGEFLR